MSDKDVVPQVMVTEDSDIMAKMTPEEREALLGLYAEMNAVEVGTRVYWHSAPDAALEGQGGVVTAIDGERYTVRLDNGVQVTAERSGIQTLDEILRELVQSRRELKIDLGNDGGLREAIEAAQAKHLHHHVLGGGWLAGSRGMTRSRMAEKLLEMGEITPDAVILSTQFVVRYALVRAKKGPRVVRKYRLPPEIKVVQIPVSKRFTTVSQADLTTLKD